MRKVLLFFGVLVAVSGLLLSQTYIAPGEGTLSQALADAEDGAVFQLAPGGTYTESTNPEFGIIVGISVTVEVEGEGDKPILQLLTEPEDDGSTAFFQVGDQGSLTLRGLEFDGSIDGVTTTNYLVTYYMGDVPASTTVKKVRVEDCYIHNLVDDVLAAGNGDMAGYVVIDSTFMDNVINTNTATSVYYKYAGSNYIEVTNSTFYNMNSYGFRIAGPVENGLPDHTPTVLIDHTTWYNIGVGDDQREMIQGEKGPLLNPWTVTNSIFVKQVAEDRTFINIKDTPGDGNATISGICFWDIGEVNFRDHTVTDTLRMDPNFADPDNGDFTLPWKSPTFTLGTNGGPIGDPRWCDNAVAIDQDGDKLPRTFSLRQNYPNPFNASTTISFVLEKPAATTLKVYDLLGNEVALLVNRDLKAGEHRIAFDATELTTGIYFYRLTSSGKSLTRKMMFLE